MGTCSSVRRTPNSIQLVNARSSVSSEVFDFSSLHNPPSSSYSPASRIIDHRNFFTSDYYPGMEGLTIHFGEYIYGLQVHYDFDSQPKVLDLMGSERQGQTYVLRLDKSEYIENFTFFYDDVALTAVKITTTKGKKVFVGNERKMVYAKELDLKDKGRVVIGFRGEVGRYLSNLWVYHAEIDERELTCYRDTELDELIQ